MQIRTLAVLALTLVGARPAGAQLVTTLDVAAASVTYENSYRISAMSLTPTLRFERPRASVFAIGTLSRFETGSISSNGSLFASLLTSGTSRVRGEIAASLSGSAHEDLTRTGRYLGQARVHAVGSRGGLWLGGGAGQAWDGAEWRAVRTGELGAWWRRGPMVLAGSVEPSGLGDTTYTDAEASLRWMQGVFELGGNAGLRTSRTVGESTWGSLNGMMWLGRFLALSVTGGRYPADHVQGMPGGTFLSVGLRFAARPLPLDLPRVRGAARPPALGRRVAGRLELRRAAGGGRVLRLEARNARRVELMGDFTEWNIVVLQPVGGGRWQLPVPVAPGTYRFNVRVDGGAWGVPSGVTTITDDFEGVVGILMVE